MDYIALIIIVVFGALFFLKRKKSAAAGQFLGANAGLPAWKLPLTAFLPPLGGLGQSFPFGITTINGTGAAALRITYPITYLDDGQIGAGRNMTTGAMEQIVPSGAYLVVFRYDNAYPVVTGDVISFLISYQF